MGYIKYVYTVLFIGSLSLVSHAGPITDSSSPAVVQKMNVLRNQQAHAEGVVIKPQSGATTLNPNSTFFKPNLNGGLPPPGSSSSSSSSLTSSSTGSTTTTILRSGSSSSSSGGGGGGSSTGSGDGRLEGSGREQIMQ